MICFEENLSVAFNISIYHADVDSLVVVVVVVFYCLDASQPRSSKFTIKNIPVVAILSFSYVCRGFRVTLSNVVVYNRGSESSGCGFASGSTNRLVSGRTDHFLSNRTERLVIGVHRLFGIGPHKSFGIGQHRSCSIAPHRTFSYRAA